MMSIGFLRLLTAFSIVAAAPNLHGCDPRLQRAFHRVCQVRERSLMRSKPAQDAEPAEGVLDERETETANPARQRKTPHSSPPGGPERRILAEGWAMRLCWVR